MVIMVPPARMKSTENEELVPVNKAWSFGYSFYKFQFKNSEDCSVIINKENTIFIPAGDGFTTTPEDAPITSFVIKEPNITYNWAGAY